MQKIDNQLEGLRLLNSIIKDIRELQEKCMRLESENAALKEKCTCQYSRKDESFVRKDESLDPILSVFRQGTCGLTDLTIDNLYRDGKYMNERCILLCDTCKTSILFDMSCIESMITRKCCVGGKQGLMRFFVEQPDYYSRYEKICDEKPLPEKTHVLINTTCLPRRWGDQFKGQGRIEMCPVCKTSALMDGGDVKPFKCEAHPGSLIVFTEKYHGKSLVDISKYMDTPTIIDVDMIKALETHQLMSIDPRKYGKVTIKMNDGSSNTSRILSESDVKILYELLQK